MMRTVASASAGVSSRLSAAPLLLAKAAQLNTSAADPTMATDPTIVRLRFKRPPDLLLPLLADLYRERAASRIGIARIVGEAVDAGRRARRPGVEGVDQAETDNRAG